MKTDVIELLKNMEGVESRFKKIAIGDELQMLGPLLHSMTVSAAALNMKDGVGSLFIAQSIATIGINVDESPAGIVGKHLDKFIKSIAKGLTSEIVWKPKAEAATEMLVEKITTTAVLLALIGGHFLAREGLGKLSAGDPETMRFTCELGLILLAKSNIVKEMLGGLFAGCGANEKSKEMAAEILSGIALFLMIASLQKRTKQKFEDLLETMGKHLRAILQKVEAQIDECLILGEVASDVVAEARVAVQMGRLALESTKSDELLSAMESLLQIAGISLENLKTDIEEIENVADMIFSNCKVGLTDMTQRGAEVSVVV